MSIKRTPSAVELYLKYLPNYWYTQEVMQHNPHSRKHLRSHPGTRFMRKGSIIATIGAIILFIFCVLINMA